MLIVMSASENQGLSHHEVDKLIVETSVVAITIWLSLGLFFAQQEPDIGLKIALGGPTILFAIAIICATISLEVRWKTLHFVAILMYLYGWGVFFAMGCSILVPQEWARNTFFAVSLTVCLAVLVFLFYWHSKKRKPVDP